MNPSRYEEAGVSIDAQDSAIKGIKHHIKQTENDRVLSELGSFGALFDISFPEMKHPVLVTSTDGVGTKLKLAFDTNCHDTIGQCLVNHCINDILVQGAKPLFFMDYIATGKLKPPLVEKVVAGMAMACKQSGLVLLGGEMAEMPGFFQPGEYDLAGFIVGVVEREKVLGPERVEAGQKLLGLPSTGLHTNGYSLARKIIFEEQGNCLTDTLPGMSATVSDVLLAIHRPYYSSVAGLLAQDKIAAMAHITGGGMLGNIPRVLPNSLSARIRKDAWEVPPLFRYITKQGSVDEQEAYRVFNMGVGMVLIVNAADEEKSVTHLQQHEPDVYRLGEVVEGAGLVELI